MSTFNRVIVRILKVIILWQRINLFSSYRVSRSYDWTAVLPCEIISPYKVQDTDKIYPDFSSGIFHFIIWFFGFSSNFKMKLVCLSSANHFQSLVDDWFLFNLFLYVTDERTGNNPSPSGLLQYWCQKSLYPFVCVL